MTVAAKTYKQKNDSKTLSTRQSASNRGYGYAWQQARKAYLLTHPLCVQHERDGKVVAAVDVDHIVPHKGDLTLFWDRDNWQALCHRCHSRKTRVFDQI